MKFLVGSTNTLKINSVKESATASGYFDTVEVEGIKVPSGVSDMPKTLDEVILGAKNRAYNLKNTEEVADYYVGIEGGTTLIGDTAYLFGVTYILSNSGISHYGLTNFVEVPELFRKGVYEDGKELADMQHEITQIHNVREKNGSFGMWTDDLVTRQASFEASFFCAIAPFYNQYYNL